MANTLNGLTFLGRPVRWGDPSLDGAARALSEGELSAGTRRAYAGHLRRFGAWCAETNGPASVQVATWIEALYAGGRSMSTLRQAMSALERAGKRCGVVVDFEPARAVMAGCARKPNKARPGVKRKASALPLEVMRSAVGLLVGRVRVTLPMSMPRLLPQQVRDAHDASLLTIGYLGAFRRGELVSLNLSDIEIVDSGDTERGWLQVTITRHKTTAESEVLLLPGSADDGPLCPVARWRDYLGLRDKWLGLGLFPADEPAWLSADTQGRLTVRRISGEKAITTCLRRALQSSAVRPKAYSAHSLRAGLATELAAAGASMPAIANAGGWTSLDTVLDYARRGRAKLDNPLLLLKY